MSPVPVNRNEEQQALLSFLLALRLDRVREFLRRHELARYGNRADLRERLEENLADGTITIIDLVDFLDEVEPWSKQHVYLYDGGDGLVEGWRDNDALGARLTRRASPSSSTRACHSSCPMSWRCLRSRSSRAGSSPSLPSSGASTASASRVATALRSTPLDGSSSCLRMFT